MHRHKDDEMPGGKPLQVLYHEFCRHRVDEFGLQDDERTPFQTRHQFRQAAGEIRFLLLIFNFRCQAHQS